MIIPILLEKGNKVEDIIKDLGLKQISDENEILEIIKIIINNNSKSVSDYKNGQERAFKFLMGQIMKETKGQVNPTMASKLLIAELERLK